MDKRCFKCGQLRPIVEFYRHPMMGDGHLGKCKVCTRRDVQENYRRRREQYLEYESRRYRDNPKRKNYLARRMVQLRQDDPQKYHAYVTYKNAVARGKLKRQPCEICGSSKSDGHHEDYGKPLVVRWLCRKHHMERHRMERVP